MKKFTLLTAAIFCLQFLSNAQVITKGKKIVGGYFSLSFGRNTIDTGNTNNNNYKNTGANIYLSPSYGRAIKNNLVFGVHLNLGYSSSNNEVLQNNQVGKSTGKNLGTGIFLEKFFPLGKGFSFSANSSFNVDYNNYKSNNYFNGMQQLETLVNGYGVGIFVKPAINYSLSNKILMQLLLNDFAGISYSNSKNETKNQGTVISTLKNNQLHGSLLLNSHKPLDNLSFGFRYIF